MWLVDEYGRKIPAHNNDYALYYTTVSTHCYYYYDEYHGRRITTDTITVVFVLNQWY